MDHFSQQIALLEQHSTYARRWLAAQPQWVDWLAVQCGKKVDLQGIRELLEPCYLDSSGQNQDEAQFMANLRLARQRLILWIALRDLSGLAPLGEVTHALSHFAELAVSASIAYIREDLRNRFGIPWSNTTQSELSLIHI